MTIDQSAYRYLKLSSSLSTSVTQAQDRSTTGTQLMKRKLLLPLAPLLTLQRKLYQATKFLNFDKLK